MNVCFNGCSLTVGEGFDEGQRNYIYDRLLEEKFQFKRTNIAISGSSNYEIFMRTADAILSNNYNCIVTQWSSLNRLWLWPGPDSAFVMNSSSDIEFRYRHIYIRPADKKKLKETLLLLNGDYHNIVNLIKFTNILKTLALNTDTKLVFINGLVPWQKDLITPLKENLNSSLSDYSKSMLDFDTRDDSEIIKFFQELQQYATQIDQSLWVNIFDSWQNYFTDKGPQGHHPGIDSHQWMADRVSEYFIEKQIL